MEREQIKIPEYRYFLQKLKLYFILPVRVDPDEVDPLFVWVTTCFPIACINSYIIPFTEYNAWGWYGWKVIGTLCKCSWLRNIIFWIPSLVIDPHIHFSKRCCRSWVCYTCWSWSCTYWCCTTTVPVDVDPVLVD